MSNPEKDDILVRGVSTAATSTTWTFLGTSESGAEHAIAQAQEATARLDAWANGMLPACDTVVVVRAEKIEPETPSVRRRARQINGVSKALSPEYCTMFGGISSDFISVEKSLLSAKKA